MSEAVALLQKIGDVLRAERLGRGLTQGELASRAGVSRPTVIAGESGRSIATQNLVAIMISLDLVFGEKDLALSIRKPKTQGSGRPRLKDLMRDERERAAKLQDQRALLPLTPKE